MLRCVAAHPDDVGLEVVQRAARELTAAFQEAAGGAANETELREELDRRIRRVASAELNLDLVATAGRRVPRAGGTGFYDRLYGGVLVEFKSPGVLDGAPGRSEGAAQALEYLEGIAETTGVREGLTAVVTDGRTLGFLAHAPDADATLFAPDLAPGDRFRWYPVQDASARQLVELLVASARTPLTGASLLSAVGPRAGLARRLVDLLETAVVGRTRDDRTDTLFGEWQRSFGIVYGTQEDAVAQQLADDLATAFDLPSGRAELQERLFAVHTYFALLTKLMAAELLALWRDRPTSRPTEWKALADDELAARLRTLEEGTLFVELGVRNLLEGELFTWYQMHVAPAFELLTAIRDLLYGLDSFAFPTLAYGPQPASDVLREMYQGLVPRSLRRQLGEFFTPRWLAELLADDVGLDGTAGVRVLDPTCGTGTFLVEVIRRRRSANRAMSASQLVADITSSIVGFDLNPVAVLAARVNYLLALGLLLKEEHPEFSIPVYMTDSVLTPRLEEAVGSILTDPRLHSEHLVLNTSLDEPFRIPLPLATREGMASLRRVIEQAADDRGLAAVEASARIRDETGVDLSADDVGVLDYILGQVRDLADADRNGVWARIIENGFAPLFAGEFDIVIGNPPWISWQALPESWRRKTESIWRELGLWPSREERRGRLPNSDVATLVFGVSVARYLKEGGRIGLLVPLALVRADPAGARFRTFRLKPDPEWIPRIVRDDIDFAPELCEDLAELQPFPDASNQCIALVARRDQQVRYPVRYRKWRRRVAGVHLFPERSWAATEPFLVGEEGEAKPVVDAEPTSAWAVRFGAEEAVRGGASAYTFGKGVDTRGATGIYVVRIEDRRRTEGKVLVANQAERSRVRPGQPALRTRREWVESELVFPFLSGADVTRWSAVPSAYIVYPYEPSNRSIALTEARLRQFPGAHSFLRYFKSILRHRPAYQGFAPSDDCWTLLHGATGHLRGAHLVLVREIADPPSTAVVGPRTVTELGRRVTPIPSHKLNICETGSKEEAHFVAAIINSGPVQRFLSGYLMATSVSPRTLARIPIPPFSAEDKGHARIAALGEQAHEATARGESEVVAELEAELDELAAAVLAGGQAQA